MKPRRMPSSWLIVSFVVALMCLAFLPSVAHADEIDDMLAAGNYAEGEVVAAFFSQDGQLVTQSEAPYVVTPLMKVGTPATGPSDGTLTVQSEKGLTLSSVTSPSLTTEELLRLLSEDADVAFVEPNYIFSLEDSEPGGATAGNSVSPQAVIADVTNLKPDLKPMQWSNWTNTADGSVFTTTQSGVSLSKISKEYNLIANATRYSSTLTVDPNGGTWNGAADPQSFTQDAQTTLTIPAPAGAVVTATFNGNGGSSPASASASRPFLQWNRTGENGELSSLTDEAVYTFSAANGVADVLTAEYGAVEVTFPTLERDGFRLGGWSESPTAAVPEFDVGDTVSLTENRTYYAVWATVLTDADVTLTDVCCQYDGTAKHPTITVISGNTLLEENTDYVLSYSGNCIEIGDYTVTVTGVNGYAGEVTASYSVSELGHTPE